VLSDLAAKFPDAADQLEAHGTWDGPVETWISDYPDGSHKTSTRMKVGGQNVEIQFAGSGRASLKCGDRLQATGIRVGSMMVASSSSVQPMAATDTASTA